MTGVVCVIASGQRTIWDDDPMAPPSRAAEAYKSRLLKIGLVYAEHCCKRVYILSPTLGFLHPDDVLNYHEEDPRKPVREGRVLDNARKTLHKVRVGEDDVILVIGGLWHYEVVRRLFPRNRVIAPLRGMTINEKYRYIRKIITNIQTGRGDCLS